MRRQKVFWNDQDMKIVSIVAFGSGIEGWPTMVHGGALGTVIDENLGRAAIRRFPARTGVTANLNINYRAPTRADQFIVIKVRLDEAQGRKSRVSGVVEDMAGNVLAEAK